MKTTFFLFASLLLIVLLASCSKSDDSKISLSSASKLVLNYEETSAIHASSEKPITYVSENPFHAKVTEVGVVTAQYVGETSILLNNGSDTKKVQVVVEPKYNLYPTPSLEWGTARAQIKAQHGTPASESDNFIGYTDYSKAAPVVMFGFDSNGKLSSSTVLVKTTHMNTLFDFLLERYLVVSVDNAENTAIFLNELSLEKSTTAIHLSLYSSSYMMVMYFNSNSTTSRSLTTPEAFIEENSALIESLLSGV